jgi:PAT family beta-lactamase induction signal transducer AmpG
MDLCNPAIGATQFTAYMSLMNLAMAYSALWQGFAAAQWGYPTTLALDAIGGCLCLAVLPLMKPTTVSRQSSAPSLDAPVSETSS